MSTGLEYQLKNEVTINQVVLLQIKMSGVSDSALCNVTHGFTLAQQSTAPCCVLNRNYLVSPLFNWYLFRWVNKLEINTGLDWFNFLKRFQLKRGQRIAKRKREKVEIRLWNRLKLIILIFTLIKITIYSWNKQPKYKPRK